MAYVDFYMDTATGSNLNAGSTTSGSAAYTSTSGNWDGTSVFTPTDGANPVSSGVAIGQWISIYPNGNTTTPYIAQITAVTNAANGPITAPNTNKFGTTPGVTTGTSSAKVGGCWADFGMIASGVALNTGTVTQSTRINIKAGTYGNSATSRTFALAGTGLLPLIWRGVNSSWAAQDSNPAATAGTDIPLWTGTQTVSITGASQVFQSIHFSPVVSGAAGAVTNSAAVVLYGCRIDNASATANGRAITNSALLTGIRCFFRATTTATSAIACSSALSLVATQVIGGAIGIAAGTQGINLWDCVISGQAGDSATVSTGTLNCVNGSWYGNATGSGINATGAATLFLLNNYFEGYTNGSAVKNSSGTNQTQRLIGTSYNNCLNYLTNFTETLAYLDVGLLAGAGFTSGAGGDFTASTYLKAIGVPGQLENSTLVGYLDGGALQRIEPAGGGITRRALRRPLQ